jgi:uroporphyrinogen decarboxylase
MGELTGKEHMIAAIRGTYTDRVPMTLITGLFYPNFAGITIKEFLTDAAKSAKAQVTFYERFRPDSLIIFNDVYLESEAMGCELEFPEDNISHIKKRPLEDKGALAGLKVPEPRRDGRLPYYLEVCERITGVVRDAAFGGSQAGPWNIAMNLRGHETLLLDTMDDPEFVHDLMKLTTETTKAFGDALLGVGIGPSFGEASASCNLISPKIYKEFIQPYHKEVREYFRAKKAFLSIHICGYIDPIAEDVVEVGMSPLSIDSPTSLEKIVALPKGKVTLMGNVPTPLFASGTKEEMEEAIRKCIDTAASGSLYILASGCEIPRNSTVDRIDHFFDYAKSYGREAISRLREERPELFQ